MVLPWWTRPGTLRHYRNTNRDIRGATNLYHFPGLLDAKREVVGGESAVQFVKELQSKLALTYAFLGINALNPDTGEVLFHFEQELALQEACAGIRASEKILFLDSSKWQELEGYVAYDIRHLLSSTDRLTFYVAASDRDDILTEKLSVLAAKLAEENEIDLSRKIMRLQLVGKEGGDIPSIDLTEQYRSKPISRPQMQQFGTR